MSNGRRKVLFCDFDGTITVQDTIIQIMREFAPPEWEEIKEKILAGRISIREGVGKMFSLLPVSDEERIRNYVLYHTEIRPGFSDLIRFTRKEGIRLMISSGGIDFFLYPLLAPYDIPYGDIYCNRGDFSGEKIRILWPHPCDDECHHDCGMCKATLLRSFPQEEYERIVIGDSITDLAAARIADRVIARDFLRIKCEEFSIPYVPFETFYDVIDYLQNTSEKAG